jgi:chemotaxis protein MotB
MSIEVEEDKPAGAPGWMTTFADLMSLLLTFFVLLLSFSNTEVVKFRELAGSMREAFGLKSELALSDMPSGESILPEHDAKEGEGEGPQVDELEQELRDAMAETQTPGEALKRLEDGTIVLQLEGDLMFGSGDARLNPRALPVLSIIAGKLRATEYSLDIVGHTDDVPIATAVYPSNWELSAARAGQAVRYLTEQGVEPRRLRAIGQADTVPVAANDGPKNRAANRRVELIFTRPAQARKGTLDDLDGAPPPSIAESGA